MKEAIAKKRKHCPKLPTLSEVEEEEGEEAGTKHNNAKMDRSGLDNTEEDDAMLSIHTHEEDELELEQQHTNVLSLFSAIQNHRLHGDPFPPEKWASECFEEKEKRKLLSHEDPLWLVGLHPAK